MYAAVNPFGHMWAVWTLTLLSAYTDTVGQHQMLVGELAHHAGCLKKRLGEKKKREETEETTRYIS